jgi:murein L,D-transpeptidase YcbB/YkuD
MRMFVCAMLLAVQSSDRIWIDGDARLTPDAREAIAILAGAARDGLDPRAYDVVRWRASMARVDARAAAADEIVALERGLEASLAAYFFHLHAGRVDPRRAGFDIAAHAAQDFALRVREAAAAHRLPAAAEETAPSHPLYRPLRQALARYRALAADPALAADEPDDVRVRRLLTAFGDLRADGNLADAVARFQRRHGLVADGVIGKSTRAALQVPLAWRVRQMELAMERLRWLPDRASERLIAVNIPMFRLWAIEGDTPSFTSDIIVGRAARTRTPVFVDALEQIVFRPSWNVPASIVRGEILPAIQRDADYLRKHDMEAFGSGSGLRVRQRPGPSNALGLIKFVFPNDENVYMHGTPAQTLFGRPRRDFSHGCIRVADPAGLAAWVLATDGWTRDRVVASMHGGSTTAVTLTHPVPVVLFYVTALVLPEDGDVHFAEDIYGHDAALDRALRHLRSGAGFPAPCRDPAGTRAGGVESK